MSALASAESLFTMSPIKSAPAAKAFPPVHVEFRREVDGGNYFPSMNGHKVAAVDVYLSSVHTEFLETERVDVSFGKAGIRVSATLGGSICHRVEKDLVRASIIFDKVDETLFYYLFALTNGKPIIVDGSSTFITDFDATMKVAPSLNTGDRSLMLVNDKTRLRPASVSVNPDVNKRISARRESLRRIPFPKRLQQVEKLVGELSVLVESMDNVAGIDTSLVLSKDGQRVRMKLKPV